MKMGVNYGLNRVRFTDAVPAGSRIRARFVLSKFENIKGGNQLTWGVTVEREGSDKPACVAEWLTRQYG
jgi:acyl dehydratase